MKKFNDICEQILVECVIPFEDYSERITQIQSNMFKGKCFKYTECANNCIISEDSLSRTLSVIQDKDFAILTAYRGNFSKAENILRNRELRAKLNGRKMGVHQLVGHWQEAPAGKDYAECSPNELTDVVERSYLVAKPEDMSFDDFESLIRDLLTIEGETQDAAIIKNQDGIFLLYNNGSKDLIGSEATLGKINQAYSQHVKHGLSFVFEGIETPVTNLGKQMFKKYNILY
jgi:hypothetical protein